MEEILPLNETEKGNVIFVDKLGPQNSIFIDQVFLEDHTVI